MSKLETAQNEIRAIFSNEVACLYETDATKLAGSRVWIWARIIKLAGSNVFEGKVCECVVNYAIHSDGYWEQIGLGHNGEWHNAY